MGKGRGTEGFAGDEPENPSVFSRDQLDITLEQKTEMKCIAGLSFKIKI